MSNTLKLLAVLLLILPLVACAGRKIIPLPVTDDYDVVAGATPSDKLKVGLIPGLYSDMFIQAIQPSLEEMGYTVEITYYDNYTLPNISLARNQIDLNMFQHYKSLNNYKFENDVALSAIAEVPTAPMGIFSSSYSSLEEIENGATISMPIEEADFSRALMVLENAGLIKLNHLVGRSNVAEDDITSNPYNLKFFPLRAENLVKSLSICELSVIDGSYAVNGNLKLSDALYQEVMDDDYLIVIAVQTHHLHAQFISDIINIVTSDEYKAVIDMEGGKFSECQRPRLFYE